MKIWGFGDHSDYRLRIHQGKDDRWYWHIEDSDGQARLTPPLRGADHGFATYEDAEDAAREVITGLGADFDDLDEVISG